MVQKQVHDLFLSNDETTRAMTSIKTKYNINISKQQEGIICKFDFTRKTKICINYDIFTCFDDTLIEDIRDLFEKWFRDIFVFSNFGMFNNRILISFSKIERNGTKEHFSFTVKRLDGKGLVMSMLSRRYFEA